MKQRVKRKVKSYEEFFKEYYLRNLNEIEEPTRIKEREFGFVLFNKEGMLRHVAFNNINELKRFIIRNLPKHVYYSSAYYENPAAKNMEEKVWKGADLIFDIDVDHIDTPCKKEHDTWRCCECGTTGKGMPPEVCPNCGSKKIEHEAWVCETCIEIAKEETLKLIEILTDELGFSDKDMYAVFSGHRGFHIHVESKKILNLDQDTRREIVDYILGIGLDYKILCTSGKYSMLDIDIRESGWRGRIARGLYEIILMADREFFAKIGLKKKEINKIIENKERILKEIEGEPSFWFTLTNILSKRSMDLLIQHVIDKYKCNIDERVTIDIKRLIRLPGSLHGKTGFKVLKMDIDEVEVFDLTKAFTFNESEEVILEVEKIPKKVANFTFNKTEGKIRVPLPIALYLIGNSIRPVKLIKIV